MSIAPDLRATLEGVAAALASARDPWWVIGSAAVALHLDAALDVADVDVLLSLADARRLLPRLGLAPGPGAPHPRFRSSLFATWRAHPLPVEFMADLRLHDGVQWRQVRLDSRTTYQVGEAEVPVPSRSELTRLLHQFGRPKDLVRAALL